MVDSMRDEIHQPGDHVNYDLHSWLRIQPPENRDIEGFWGDDGTPGRRLGNRSSLKSNRRSHHCPHPNPSIAAAPGALASLC